MNSHYKQGAVETRDFATAVINDLATKLHWKTNKSVGEIADMCADAATAVKYAQRAGLKEGEPWEKDAKKMADYLFRFKMGYFPDQEV